MCSEPFAPPTHGVCPRSPPSTQLPFDGSLSQGPGAANPLRAGATVGPFHSKGEREIETESDSRC